MPQKELLSTRFPGCGAKLNKNGKKGRCRYHVQTPIAEECFPSKAVLLDRVAPMNADAPEMIREDIDGIAFAILRLSLDAHDMRGEYPPEPPEVFEREHRVYDVYNGYPHHGWKPVWRNGEGWSGWSYQKGFMSDPQRVRFNTAARNEVMEQIIDVREGCGIPNCHVHHAAPWTFKALLDAFIEKEGVNPQLVSLTEYGYAYYFADKDFGGRWQDFHAYNANLVALTPSEHAQAHRNEAAGLTWDGHAPLTQAAE